MAEGDQSELEPEEQKWVPKRKRNFNDNFNSEMAKRADENNNNPRVYQEHIYSIIETKATTEFVKKHNLRKEDTVHGFVRDFGKCSDQNREEVRNHIQILKKMATNIHSYKYKEKRESDPINKEYASFVTMLGINYKEF